MTVLDELHHGLTTRRLGTITHRVQDTGHSGAQPLSVFLDGGVVPRTDRADNHNQLGSDLDKYQLVQPGDLVFNRLRTWQGGFGASRHTGIVSPAYIVARTDAADARYLDYVLHSAPYLAELVRISKWMPPSQFDVLWADLRRVEIPWVPLEEQRRIADFLDERVARADQIIAARREQARCLDEVTRSRVDEIILGKRAQHNQPQEAKWAPFGSVPDGWREGRLRNLDCTVQTGPFGSQLHSDEYVANGWPVINPASLTDEGLRAIPGMAVDDETRDRLSRHILRQGDIVFGRRGEMGRACLVSHGQAGWLCGTGSLRVRLYDPLVQPAFLVSLLRTAAVRFYFTKTSVGSTMENLNTDILLGVPILIPPAEVQTQLLDEVDSISASLRANRRGLAASMDLITEYKRSLITAAVTGELDVTTAGSGIPR